MRNTLRTVTGGTGTSPFNPGDRVIKSRQWSYVYNDYTPTQWDNGVTLHTPAIGDEILNIIFHIPEAWDGTAAAGVGTFVNTVSPFHYMNIVGSQDEENYGEGISRSEDGGPADIIGYWASSGTYGSTARILAANPIKLVISQTGDKNGGEIVSTQGAIIVEIVWSTTI